MAISLKTTSGKILASVALVGTAAAVAGMGTYGAFTSSTSASQAVTAGTVTIALGAPGAANTLNVPVTNILPGDKVEKLVTLANTGNSDLNNITLTTNAGTTATLLTTDATNGLQLTIENCSV
ncbi:TasA family protein, partial [Paenarthrobacter ilicis]